MKRDQYNRTWQTANSLLTQTDQGLQRLFAAGKSPRHARTGVGWTHSGHHLLGARGGKDWILDPNRSWKTKWKITRGGIGRYSGNTGLTIGKELGWLNPWGNRTSSAGRDRANLTTRYWHTGSGKHAVELLDWDAYDRDSLYGAWLTHSGKDKFNTLQDIYDAEEWLKGGQGGIGGPGYDDTELRNRIGGAEGGIRGLRSDLSQYSKIKDRDRLLGVVNARLTDLEKVGIKEGDIEDLRKQLKDLGDSQASGDEALERLVNEYKQEGKLDMANRLSETRQMLRGEWGQDIAALDIAGIRRSIEGAKGDITGLTSDFAGLKGDLDLMGSEFEKEIAATKAGLQGELSGLALESAEARAKNKEENLKALAGVESDLSKRINDTTTELTQAAQKDKAEILRTRAEQIAALEDDWSGRLKDQETTLQGEIDKESTALHERIRKISSSLNYRMIGDTAGGVAMRRSEAFKSGKAFRGTEQLARAQPVSSTMKISTLNL